jgi:hypothetical protein
LLSALVQVIVDKKTWSIPCFFCFSCVAPTVVTRGYF